MYNVIKITDNNVVLENSTYQECLNWIENYGDILNYTIILCS
jgi:hypothetical protein